MVALEGQQSERVTYALVNSTPWSTRSFRVFGRWARSRAFMSSASMNSMLGFGLATWRGSSLSGRHVRASERALSNANVHKMFTGPYHPPLPQHSVDPNVDRSDESAMNLSRRHRPEGLFPRRWANHLNRTRRPPKCVIEAKKRPRSGRRRVFHSFVVLAKKRWQKYVIWGMCPLL